MTPDEANPSSRSDDLIRRARTGDEDAIAGLYHLYENRLAAAVRTRLGDKFKGRVDSHDIIQSVWKDLLDDLADFEYRGPDSFFRCLLNRLVYKIQVKQRFHTAGKRDVNREERPPSDRIPAGGKPLHAEPDPTPSEHAMDRERLEQVEEVLGRLPGDQRSVLIHRIRDEWEFEKIGEKTGRSAEAVRKLYHRGMKKVIEHFLNRRDRPSPMG